MESASGASADRHAAVDAEDVAGDEAAAGAEQEEDGVVELADPAPASEWRPRAIPDDPDITHASVPLTVYAKGLQPGCKLVATVNGQEVPLYTPFTGPNGITTKLP